MTEEEHPLATYRLQFNHDFQFDDARELVPYLSRLGITHIYSSPILRARSDSTHGYDVVDPTTVNPNLGDEVGFRTMVTTLQAHGMGVILDIVPNHMAASSTENLYWRDVLTFGVSSTYVQWFDVDWRMPKPETWGRVLVPVLGAPLPRVLENDEIALVWDDGRFAVRYYDHIFPVDPATVPTICQFGLGELQETVPQDYPPLQEIRKILGRLAKIPRRAARTRRQIEIPLEDVEMWQSQLARQIELSPQIHDWAVRTAERFGAKEAGRQRLRKLLDAQCYRLTYWRVAARAINYRRFFDINDLISVRQEDPHVFDETHSLIGRWVQEGLLDGLRVDHVDGLRDPLGYLARLSQLAKEGEQPPEAFHIFVEKILGPKEQLPEEWPVDGTTGYEFLNQVESIFVSSDGYEEIVDNYQRLMGQPVRFARVLRRSKRRVLKDELSSFVGRLADLLLRLARYHPENQTLTETQLVHAIVEVVVGLPVYRTYVDSAGVVSTADQRWIETALARARRSHRAVPEAVKFLGQVLLLEDQERLPENERQERLNFIERFQQLTGPATAKGVEDTALYSFVPLVSLNEVGGEPHRPLEDSVGRLHRASRRRARDWPGAMLCSTTHDTKRSADVRSRLDVISEMPKLWNGYVTRWQELHRQYRRGIRGKLAPEASAEYLLYQTLVALWPAPDPEHVEEDFPDADALSAITGRLEEYMLKAAREAKSRTSWVDGKEDYENALVEFVRSAVAVDGRDSPFLRDVQQLVARISRCGFWNALSRLLIQYAAPGTPDLYQGDELWNFTLVDPDNRRPVDYELRKRLLDEVVIGFESPSSRTELLRQLVHAPEDGRIKLHTLRCALSARRDHPGLFAHGEYIPLEATGALSEHVVSFARADDSQAAVVIVPRLPLTLLDDSAAPPIGRDVWSGTAVSLPERLQGRSWRCLVTGEQLAATDAALRVAEALKSFPVALLLAE